jgi:hypothetical protein
MKRFFLVLMFVGSAARADEDAVITEPQHIDLEATADGASLPLSIAASRHELAVVSGYGGYDGARNAGIMDVAAELRLYGPLYVRGGATYLSDTGTLKPTIGLELQFLQQTKHGISASLGVFYKPEGLDEPEGEVEAVLSLGRRFGRTTLLLNAAYGQDAELNESDAELRGAALVRVGRSLFTGFDARYRFAIVSKMNGEPDWDVVAGPVMSYVVSGFTLSAQVGASALSIASATKTGVIALGGLSRTF